MVVGQPMLGTFRLMKFNWFIKFFTLKQNAKILNVSARRWDIIIVEMIGNGFGE